MSENTTEVLVGGAVLAVAIGFLVYAGQATGLSGGQSEYELAASFRSADGVDLGTDVRMAGVKVGRVTGIELDPTTYRASTVFTQGSVSLVSLLMKFVAGDEDNGE